MTLEMKEILPGDVADLRELNVVQARLAALDKPIDVVEV